MDSEYKFDLAFRELVKNDNREVPEAVRNRVNEILSALPVRRPVLKKACYFSAAVVLVFCCVLGLGLISPAVAQALKQIPVISYVFEKAGDSGLQAVTMEGLATPINQTVSDNGIEITITEGVFDGARISIGYVQESYFGPMEIERPNIWVNGKKVNFGSGYAGKMLSPTKVAGIIYLDLLEDLPDSFTMEMVIDAVGIIPGKWDFKFPVSLGKSGLVTEPGITKSYKDIEITVKKVVLTPSATNLKMQIKRPPKYYEDFRLYDDRGLMLQNFSGYGTSDSNNGFETMQVSTSFAPVWGKPKYLVLRPVIHKWGEDQKQPPSPDVVTELTGKLPVTINQGRVGSLTITKVEYLPDKTLVHYEVEGSDPYNQSWLLWLRDGQGRDYNINTPGTANPKRESEDRYAFVREFPACEKGEKLKAVTKQFDGPAFLKELEIRIPLKW